MCVLPLCTLQVSAEPRGCLALCSSLLAALSCHAAAASAAHTPTFMDLLHQCFSCLLKASSTVHDALMDGTLAGDAQGATPRASDQLMAVAGAGAGPGFTAVHGQGSILPLMLVPADEDAEDGEDEDGEGAGDAGTSMGDGDRAELDGKARGDGRLASPGKLVSSAAEAQHMSPAGGSKQPDAASGGGSAAAAGGLRALLSLYRRLHAAMAQLLYLMSGQELQWRDQRFGRAPGVVPSSGSGTASGGSDTAPGCWQLEPIQDIPLKPLRDDSTGGGGVKPDRTGACGYPAAAAVIEAAVVAVERQALAMDVTTADGTTDGAGLPVTARELQWLVRWEYVEPLLQAWMFGQGSWQAQHQQHWRQQHGERQRAGARASAARRAARKQQEVHEGGREGEEEGDDEEEEDDDGDWENWFADVWSKQLGKLEDLIKR